MSGKSAPNAKAQVWSDGDADSLLDDEARLDAMEARENREDGADAHNMETFGVAYLEDYPLLPSPSNPRLVSLDSHTSR